MIGAFSFCLFIPLPRLLSLSAYKITTFLQLTSSQFILTHPNSSIIIQTNPNLTQIFTEITEIFVLRTILSHTDLSDFTDFLSSSGLFNCPAEMKEIKEIFRFALCAQPVPKALSFISFISAGLKNLCDLCNLCAITPATLLRKPCLFTPLPMPPNLIKDRTLSI